MKLFWKEKVVNKRIVFSIMMLMPLFALAQTKTPILERIITIKVSNEKLEAVLLKISQQATFNFSYNPAIINSEKIVSVNATKKSVREVLNILFNGKIIYKERNGYLILLKSKEESVKSEKKISTFEVSGYVSNERGEKIQWVSIYDKQTLASAITNSYGFYKIQFEKSEPKISLSISKKNYNDTIISINKFENQFLNITLSQPINDSLKLKQNNDSISNALEKTANDLFLSVEQEANSINISDTLHRDFQISVVPFIGTNGKLSGNVVNDYSFNILGGYSSGTNKFEVGTFFNIDRGDVHGCQIAGLTNGVKGNVHAAQLTGLVNLDWKNAEGFQLAGLVNSVGGKFYGAQISGLLNTVVDTVQGIQIAGLINQSNKFTQGMQLAGLANFSINNMEGMQIAGLINYAKEIKGCQLGFFNYSNKITGVPIGFLSISKSGYHKIELSADEVFYTNIAFRSGVNAFHNILTSGIQPTNDSLQLWTFGYGLGSTIKVTKNFAIDIDVTCNQIVKGNNFDALNLLNKGYLGFDVRLAKKFSIAFGGTVNGQLTKTDYNFYPEIFSDIKPHIFYETTYTDSNLHLKMWIGGKVALRFL